MARSSQPALRLRSKTRKQTTNRSSARYGREELDALKKRKNSGSRTEDSAGSTRGGRAGGASTSRSSSRTSDRSASRTSDRSTSRTYDRSSDGNPERKTSRTTDRRSGHGSERGVDRAYESSGTDSRSRRGASRKTDAVERSTGMKSGERRRTQREAIERIEEQPVTSTKARLQMPIPGKQVEQTDSLRLNKFLADAGIASRRGADELIEAGVVKVNGIIVTEQGTRVHASDLVTVKGEPVSYLKHLSYLVLNKPKDFITTTNDEKGRKTVMDLIPIKQRLYPVGRLDRNTTGTLIITNDGELAARLMHPSHEIEREYVVGLDDRLKSEHAKAIAHGVELEDGMTGPAELLINPDDRSEVHIVLREGRNREVRRLFEHFGYEVKRLHRVRYANISVVGLARGDYRHLSRDEVRQLRKLVGLKN